MRRVDDPGELARLFGQDRETHLYGLADLEEPFWPNSVWYRDGDAVVGLVSVGDDWLTGYAMSREAPEATLRMLAEIQATILPGTWITGPTGMYDVVSRVRRSRDIGPHWRMIIDPMEEVHEAMGVVSLGPEDVDAVVELHRSDEGSAFFLPAMLTTNPFVGIWDGDLLVASAGTHVASTRHGVAAIGAVITRPSHRGRGLGRSVMSGLCARLAGEYETIGLNVEMGNEPAVRLYESLGFRRVFAYEEIELL